MTKRDDDIPIHQIDWQCPDALGMRQVCDVTAVEERKCKTE